MNPTFTEGGAAADVFSTVAASAIEAAQTFTSMTVTVTNVTDGASESINFDGSNVILTNGNLVTTATNGLNVTVGLVGTTATVSFSGAALTPAQVQTLIDGISYLNTSQDPTDANRVVTITQLVDSGLNGGPNGDDSTWTVGIASSVNVDPVNDEPTLTATGNNPTYNEDDASPADIYSTVTASTIEVGQSVTSMTLTVTNVTDGASEVLNFDGSAVALTDLNAVTTAGNTLNVTVSLVGTTATVTFSGASLNAAAVQTLVDSLSYQNNSQDPTDADRVVTITQLVDSGANGGPNNDDNTATLTVGSTVNVDPVNDAPVFGPALTPFGDTPTFIENGPAIVLDSDANDAVGDLELVATGNYDGAKLIVSAGLPRNAALRGYFWRERFARFPRDRRRARRDRDRDVHATGGDARDHLQCERHRCTRQRCAAAVDLFEHQQRAACVRRYRLYPHGREQRFARKRGIGFGICPHRRRDHPDERPAVTVQRGTGGGLSAWNCGHSPLAQPRRRRFGRAARRTGDKPDRGCDGHDLGRLRRRRCALGRPACTRRNRHYGVL